MNGVFSRRGLRAALSVAAVAATTLLAISTTAFAAGHPLTRCADGHGTRVGRFAGIVGAVNVKAGCETYSAAAPGSTSTAGDTANGTPPLIWHGGPVMGTASTGPLVITPIFWNPADHPMTADYKSIIKTYLSDVAAASGRTNNVYSIATEYSGTDGAIRYRIALGNPIDDTNALPASGCNLLPADRSGVYADGSGYNACLDDSQVVAETDRIINTTALPRDFAHIYLMFLPKHVETCYYAGTTSNTKNGCTINHEPSAAFCAYHSQASSGTIYGNMAYPIYASPVGYTCSSDAQWPVVQTPNGNPDADTEVSLISHEAIEAWTDPDAATGWFDSSLNEIGDECAYLYGATSGTSGQYYNQTFGKHHYLTQEEFSNNSFFQSGGGCLQGER